MKMVRIVFVLALFGLVLGCDKKKETADKSVPEGTIQVFSSLPSSKTGVTFNNVLKESPQRHYSSFNPIYDGGGVATGDFNNDGLPDLYFTGNEVDNKLYLNKGDLQFEDITEKAGVAAKGGWKNGVSLVDINHDGWLDIYVCKGGWIKDSTQRRNLLYINKGDLTFTEEAKKYGLDDPGYSFQSAFFDADNDGDLDVYVINHPDKSNLTLEEYKEGKAHGSIYCKDHFYRNHGNGTFSDVTNAAGLRNDYGFGLSISTSDLDHNGYVDIYVSNDYQEPDYLYLNNGNGTFTESIKERTGHISFFSMGVDIADLDNDGWEDIFVSEMLPEDYKRSKINMASMNAPLFNRMVDEGFHLCYMHNVLQMNRGNGYFSDVAQLTGMSKTDWSWACFMSDFDNDGLKDVFVANGYTRDLYDKDAIKKMNEYFAARQGKPSNIQEVMDLYHSEKLVSYIYKNNGNMSFTKMSQAWGLTEPSFSNGASIADFDQDGDLDLVVNNLNQEAYVYQNNSEKTNNHFLRVKAEGPATNPQGLGATITITYEGGQQMEQLKLNRGYLGTVEPITHFGLGQVQTIKELKVEWLDGKVNTIKNPSINTLVTVNYKEAVQQNKTQEKPETLLSEITSQAFKNPFVHKENDYDDFKTQILLPHRQSRNGPFIAVADVNGDALEDFYVGGAAGQAGALYVQNPSGQFDSKDVKAFSDDKGYEDMGVLFFDADGDRDNDLYIVSGGFEFPAGSANYQDRLYINDSKGNFTRSSGLPKITSSGSCVTAGDIDGDGDLDLFVGGRVIPDRYPYPPQSYIFINDKGVFTDQTSKIAPGIAQIGMVTSALWTDLDADGKQDLMLTGEWMSWKIFKNDNGKLQDISDQYLSDPNTGWWNKIVQYDIDGDGDQDYLGGNVGLNYKFSASKEKPFQVYCEDFDKNGSYDIVLAKFVGNEQKPVRGKECMTQQMPFVSEKFPTYHAFADAGVSDICGDELKKSFTYKSDWFASSFLINDQGTLHVHKMPLETQYSSVNGIVISDFDGDGDVDVLIGGNMYGSEVETTRGDASYGIVLIQQPDHSFVSKGYLETGFFIPYDVKDMQLIHIGADKKVGVLVGCNNNTLRLYTGNSAHKE
ncbi:MAG TPA: VCBS repeat-containing protein, partial [Saprospiraceae bacterium]|nr:VCBS repeat-containing protein [Saprospiraceae bacterium]